MAYSENVLITTYMWNLNKKSDSKKQNIKVVTKSGGGGIHQGW